MKGYLIFTIFFMVIYTVRHFIFTINRLFGEQRIYYQDIVDSELKSVTVLVPMHNEQAVVRNVLERLLKVDYDMTKFEVIPINDHSDDDTKNILDDYATRHPDIIKPLHRYSGTRGKPAALNEAMQKASGEVIIVFDADYLPPVSIIKNIAICFNDPEVGAVMGRVVPINTRTNLLTQLLDLERSGGYQVDQQARYNMKLMPQYGGTVGGFRRETVMNLGSFNERILAEDTELTYRLSINGWKILYANRVECYEEVPETWAVRARQIRRWSRGHNDVMFRYFWPVIKTPYLTTREKVDGILLMLVYAVPFFLILAMIISVILFAMGDMQLFTGVYFLIFMGVYNTFGNFAPFYQIGVGCLLDGMSQRIFLLPLLIFNFFFYMWYISRGLIDAIIDKLTSREAKWHKTDRFRKDNEVILVGDDPQVAKGSF